MITKFCESRRGMIAEKRKKVLHINSYYSTRKFYKNLYDKQIQAGNLVRVVVPVSSSFNQPDWDFGDYTAIQRSYRAAERLFFFIRQKKIVESILSDLNVSEFEILHAHSLFSNGYTAMQLKRRYGIPFLVAVRDTDVNIFFKYRKLLGGVGREVLREADAVVFLSSPYLDYAIEHYVKADERAAIKNKSYVIPNGIDRFFIENRYQKSQREHNRPINILTVGEVCKRKNQTTVLKAVEHLNRTGHPAQYSVIGKPVSQSILRKLLKSPYVNYIPHLEKEALIEEYRKADVFVMPSLTETFGLTYAEAMTQGLPVIYSKGQGFDGQFSEGAVGYAVNPRSPLDIVEKVSIVLANHSEISKNCANLAGKFSWNAIFSDYQKLYSSIKRTTAGLGEIGEEG